MIKKLLLCLLGAIGLGLSQPFFIKLENFEFSLLSDYWGLLSLVSYVPWFWAVSRSNLKQTFGLSLFAGTIQYSIVLYWIYIACHDYGYISPWLSLIITFLLALVMGLENALFFTIGRHISIKSNRSFFILAPFMLLSLEYFRNYQLFGGFPWGNPGYSLGRVAEFCQIASILGIYGLVLLVGISNAILAYSISSYYYSKYRFKIGLFILFGFLCLSYLFGYLKINQDLTGEKNIKIALLQGNIPQSLKSSQRAHSSTVLNTYKELVKKAKEEGVKLVIWPESAYPKLLKEDISHTPEDLDLGLSSIMGAVAYGFSDKDQNGYHYQNSAFLIDYNNNITGRYDKSHLVPFGEYVPWPLHGIVKKVIPGMGAFLPGFSYKPVLLPIDSETKISLGVTVCYEGIFPEISLSYAQKNAELMVNITNDAWYGFSSAPYQHLLMYRIRAVETGLSYIRATNSGISAIINPYGHILSQTGLFTPEVLMSQINIFKSNNLYKNIGDFPVKIINIIFMFLFLFFSLPVLALLKKPPLIKIILSLVILLVSFLAQYYYSGAKFITDESANTKSLLIFTYSFIIILGLLSKAKQASLALKIAGAILSIFAIILGFMEQGAFFWGLLFGIGLMLWGFKKKSF